MENNSSSLNTSTINNLLKDFGSSGLTISCKANQYSNQIVYSERELERILGILLEADDGNVKRIELISIILYLLSEFNMNYSNNYHYRLENNYSALRRKIKLNEINELYLIFNKIEFEERFRTMNSDHLKILERDLISFAKFIQLHPDNELLLLYEHYEAVIAMLLYKYEESEQKCTYYLPPRISELSINEFEKPALVEYVELKNNYMLLKIYESKSNSNIFEALIAIQDLYTNCLTKNDNYGIRVGFKFTDFLFKNLQIDKMYPILNDMLTLLKKKMIFGQEGISNFLEMLLNVICRLIFCAIILNKTEDAQRFLKKLHKYINLIKVSKLSDSMKLQTYRDELLNTFQLYLIIFKSIILKNEIIDLKDHATLRLLEEYKSKNLAEIHNNDTVLINLYILSNNDREIHLNFDKNLKRYTTLINEYKIKPIDLCYFMLIITNKISSYTNNILKDPSIEKQKQYNSEIRSLSKMFINYINFYQNNYQEIPPMLEYPYFKDVAFNIYYGYFYSFYHERNYQEGLKRIEAFLNNEYNKFLNPSNKQAFLKILKLNGDLLFKSGNYQSAIKFYKQVLTGYEDINQKTSYDYALMFFNIGVCLTLSDNKPQAKDALSNSLKSFDYLNKTQNNQYLDQVENIKTLLDNMN